MESKIREMEVLLEKMNRLFHTIKIAQSHVNKIELDMMKEYTRSFYELILEHESGKDVSVSIEEKKVSQIIIEKSIPEVKPVIEIPKVNYSEIIPPVKKIEEAPVAEIKQEPVKDVPVNKKPLRILEPEHDDDERTTGLNNKLSGEKKTLADKIKRKNVDLRSAIDLNDKLFLIRELFRGDHNTYDKTIRNINEKISMADAQSYIEKELMLQYGWKRESPGLERLMDVLQEKFG